MKQLITFFLFIFCFISCQSGKKEPNANEQNQQLEIPDYKKIESYNDITIAGISFKYPKNWKITDKSDAGKMVFFTIMSDDEREISLSVQNNEVLTHSDLETYMKDLEDILIENIRSGSKVEPKVSDFYNKKIDKYSVKVREIFYKKNIIYIYGIETENNYIRILSQTDNYHNEETKEILQNIIGSLNFKNDKNEIAKIDDLNKEEEVIKYFKKLKLPINNWKIEKDESYPDLDMGVLFLSDENGAIVSLMYNTHKFITDIHEYSEHANEKIVRNMKPIGTILTSEDLKDMKFKGINAVKETFNSLYKTTGEISKLVCINLKYKNYFYSLNYSETQNAELLISKIEFIK